METMKKAKYWLSLDTYADSIGDGIYHKFFDTLKACKEEVTRLIAQDKIVFSPRQSRIDPETRKLSYDDSNQYRIYIALIRRREDDCYHTIEKTYNGYSWERVESVPGLEIHKDISFNYYDRPLSCLDECCGSVEK